MPQVPLNQRFVRGIDSDTGYFERDGMTYLDAQNVRILRREGQDGWVASLGGNEEHIVFPEGFVPVCNVYYQGVIFFWLHNEFSGNSQIGNFPSVNPSTGQYERVYRPLNWTLQSPWEYLPDGCGTFTVPPLQPLTTNQLGLSLDHSYRALARGESDGSVSLYWTDGVVPMRVINTCFDLVTGQSTGRYLSAQELYSGQWDISNENIYHPIYSLLNVSSGGQLKAGHYFFTVRYTDTQFSNTSFLSQSAPVAVTLTVAGGVQKGGESSDTSDKQVELLLTNLDPNAALIEIGFLRYLSEDEYEANLILTRYPLDGTGQLQVTITGREPMAVLTTDEIVALKPFDSRVAFDIEQLNNTLYIANTRGVQIDHPDLRELACLVEMDETLGTVDTVKTIFPGQTDQAYGDPFDVYEKVGYFSGETYTFAILPVLRSGFYGTPIPIRGTDHYTGVSVGTNEKGIFRFSQSDVVPYWDVANERAVVKGIEFLTNTVAVQNLIAGSQWIQDNVVGFYFCRAERVKNMLWQGLSLYGFNGKVAVDAHKEFGFSGSYSSQFFSDYINPLFEPAMYGAAFAKDSVFPIGSGDVEGFTYYGGLSLFDADQSVGYRKLCILSNDYSNEQAFVPGTIHVRRIQTTSYNLWDRIFDSNGTKNAVTLPYCDNTVWGGITNIWPEIGIDTFYPGNNGTTHFVGYNQRDGSFLNTTSFKSEAVDVPLWQANPVGGGKFVSKRLEGADGQQNGMYFLNPNTVLFPERNKEFSLPIANPSYIGIENAPADIHPYDNYGLWNRAVVGVYRSDPDTVQYDELYDPSKTFYYPIGNFIPITDFADSTHVRWQGDCFVSRTYQRLVSSHVQDVGTELTDLIAQKEAVADPNYPPIDLEKGWGYWVSYICEHAYNPNYRIEKGRNLFYPASGLGDEGPGFAWQLDAPESNLYNESYKRMVTGRAFLPIDPLQPISTGNFETRIRASDTHITGAVKDGYRKFNEANKIDMDYSKGPIRGLRAIGEYLYSVQENAINLHPIQERVQQTTDKGTTFAQGSIQKLPPYRTYISDALGTQHRYGIVVGKAGLYGYDYRKRTWWRVAGTQLEDLTLTRKAQTWLYNHLPFPRLSDRVYDVNDKPLRKIGINMSAWDEYGQIWMTVHDEGKQQTLVFSELLDAFELRATVNPTMFVQAGKDMILFDGANIGWLMESGDDLVLFGQQQLASIRMVMGQPIDTPCHWDALVINSNNRPFKEIFYETQHQRATQLFDNPTEFWYKPMYRENQWKQSIRRADTTIEPELSIYQDDSRLVGQYLIVELTYEQPRRMWLQGVKFIATPSKA